jgi:hypothetical protein
VTDFFDKVYQSPKMAVTATPLLLKALATRSLDSETLHLVAYDLARATSSMSLSDADARAYCIEQLTATLGYFDNARQVLGVITDLPLSTRVEKWAIRKVVEQSFSKVSQDQQYGDLAAATPVPTLAPVPVSPPVSVAAATTCGSPDTGGNIDP